MAHLRSLLQTFAALCLACTAAAQTTAIVDIDTTHTLRVPARANFCGGNMQIMSTGESYLDPRMQTMLSELHLGWMRFPGGTVDDVWDWRTGMMPTPWIDHFKTEKEKDYDGFLRDQAILQAKGGNTVDDYAKFLPTQRTDPEGTPGSSPTHTIGVINIFTDTPDSAAKLALAAEQKNLHIDVWELGNEPFYFKGFFKTGADYLRIAEPFAKAIKAAVPHAKVAVYIQRNDAWLQSMAGYRNRYWDEIYWHPYPGAKEGDAAQKIAFYNEFLLNQTNRWVDGTVARYFGPGMQLEVSEYGVGAMRGGVYAATFLAEFLLRLSADPYVTQAGMHVLVGHEGNGDNAIGSREDHIEELVADAKAGKVVDTTKLDFGFYYTPYGLALQLVDPVIGTSAAMFPTTVTGGQLVVAGEGAGGMPAVYAQAFRSAGGANHLLLTNKSGKAQPVAVRMNGQPVQAKFLTRSFGADDPDAKNSAGNHNNVTIVSSTSQDSITVPPYGVMDVVWAAKPLSPH